MYQHKSGAEKRKERAEREKKNKEEQKKQTSLNFFLKLQSPADNSPQQSILPENDDKPPDKLIAANPSSGATGVLEDDLCEMNDHEQIRNSPEKNTEEHDSEALQSFPEVQEQSNRAEQLNNFDIGTLKDKILNPQLTDDAIRRGHEKMPTKFPRDRLNELFPISLLFKNLPNKEKVERNWLVWSRILEAFFCLPCRLFGSSTAASRSHLCHPEGYSKNQTWKKLYERLPAHENTQDHIQCYVMWRTLETRLENDSSVDALLSTQIASEAKKWREILKRVLDTILFLGERGLALRGDSDLIGNPNNGNFLGVLEIISHYDSVLRDHLQKVKDSQQSHHRLQVHYLSHEIQNEFIELCAQHVQEEILKEREDAKYYALIVDSTPDSSHVEQTTFVLRFLRFDEKERTFTIKERFLTFADCNKKTGQDIANLIRGTLGKYNIPLIDCRGQGYDNARNMSGQYQGAQSIIREENPYAVYSPCGAHSLNLCGVDSAECCPKAITFFGVIQKCFNIFSGSPQRWELLQKNIPSSLHSLSDTRWSARVDAVKPFAKHLSGIRKALEELKELNLTVETLRDINGIQKYMNSFECILMSSMWFKILSAINERNVVLQARGATIDVETDNLKALLSDLQFIRNRWGLILSECKLVAREWNIPETLPTSRKRKRPKVFLDDEDASLDVDISEEEKFKTSTFLNIIDSVIAGMTKRFEAVKNLNEVFSFLWKFTTLDEDTLQTSAGEFTKKYEADVSEELKDEIVHLKHIYVGNFEENLPPFRLLNALYSKNLQNLFPNVCVSLRIFCTLPVSVASGERSFSVLSRVKNFHRTCSSQKRLTGLAILCLESELARQLDFNVIIDSFAFAKARKTNLIR